MDWKSHCTWIYHSLYHFYLQFSSFPPFSSQIIDVTPTHPYLYFKITSFSGLDSELFYSLVWAKKSFFLLNCNLIRKIVAMEKKAKTLR